MQYIARYPLIWLLRVSLILVMMFPLLAVGFGELYSTEHETEQQQKSSEVDRYERKFIKPARTTSPITPYIGVVRISDHGRTSAASATPILPALCISFCPIIYKFLLQLRLYPLKFITHFVTIPTN